jgi:thioredoxin-related protein
MAKNINLFCFIFLILFFTQIKTFTEDQVWLKDVEAGFKKAQEDKKPIIVFVTAPWCSYCTIMHNSTISTPIVEQLLENYVRIEVDFDTNSEFCGKWKINQLPATMLLNQHGEFVARETGAIKQLDFVKWIGKNDNLAKSEVSKMKAQQDQINMLVYSFKNATLDKKNEIFSSLEKFYFQEKDKTFKEFISLKILETIQIQPQFLGNLLNSPKLESRILSANIMANLKLEVEYDPWEPFQARNEKAKLIVLQIEKIKEKIILPEK